MMGAEGPGLSDAALEVADERLYIPIESETESLNVAAAAAVCLFSSAAAGFMSAERFLHFYPGER